jgi:amino acid permease
MGLVLPSGGPVSFLYGFILCVLCNFTVVASLGELAAIFPTAGGQYHFVYALCTEKWRNLAVGDTFANPFHERVECPLTYL